MSKTRTVRFNIRFRQNRSLENVNWIFQVMNVAREFILKTIGWNRYFHEQSWLWFMFSALPYLPNDAVCPQSLCNQTFGWVWVLLLWCSTCVYRDLSLCHKTGSDSLPFPFPQGGIIGGHSGQAVPLVIFGGASILAGLLTFMLPETLGTTLPETIEDGKKFKQWVQSMILLCVFKVLSMLLKIIFHRSYRIFINNHFE